MNLLYKPQLHGFSQKSFQQKLNWLMEEGICYVDKKLYEREEDARPWEWSDAELADAIIKIYNVTKKDKIAESALENIARNIKNWRKGQSACRHEWWGPLLLVFFGREPEHDLKKFRDEFRRSLIEAWNERSHVNELEKYGLQITEDADIDIIYDFDSGSYHEADRTHDDIPKEQFWQWHRAYSIGFLKSCYHRKDIITAVTGMFPVPAEWESDFMKGETNELTLTGKMIADEVAQQQRLLWYFSGIAVHKAHKATTNILDNHWPKVIGYALLTWVRREGKSIGNDPLTIVAEGATRDGVRLLRIFGFEADTSVSSDQRPRFIKRTTLSDMKKHIMTIKELRRCTEFLNNVEREWPN